MGEVRIDGYEVRTEINANSITNIAHPIFLCEGETV
jgi:hypothetical protein